MLQLNGVEVRRAGYAPEEEDPTLGNSLLPHRRQGVPRGTYERSRLRWLDVQGNMQVREVS